MSATSGILVVLCVLCFKTMLGSGLHGHPRSTTRRFTEPRNESQQLHLRHENVGKRASVSSAAEPHKDIEYRLTKLEVQVEDKAKVIKDLEYKTIDLESGLNEIKNQVGHKRQAEIVISEDTKVLNELQQNISQLFETARLELGILELLRRDVSSIKKDTRLLLQHFGYQPRQNIPDEEEEEQNRRPSVQNSHTTPTMNLGEEITNQDSDPKSSNMLKGLNQKVTSLLDYSYSSLEALGNIRQEVSTLSKNVQFLLDRQGDTSPNDVQTTPNNSSLPQIPPGIFEIPTTNSRTSLTVAKNCRELREQGIPSTGIYQIQPTESPSFPVVCEMETSGGGWTYILNRYDGSQDFFRGWIDYKNGFGNLAGEFWLGLDHINELTGSAINELYIELTALNGEKSYAHYDVFGIGDELEGYMLKILGGYSGTAGDSLTYHAGNRFSTKDLDQDLWLEGNCAIEHSGAWWYKSCDKSNLNGKYIPGDIPNDQIYQGIYWDTFRGPQHGLAQVRMMIRPQSMQILSSSSGVFEN